MARTRLARRIGAAIAWSRPTSNSGRAVGAGCTIASRTRAWAAHGRSRVSPHERTRRLRAARGRGQAPPADRAPRVAAPRARAVDPRHAVLDPRLPLAPGE